MSPVSNGHDHDHSHGPDHVHEPIVPLGTDEALELERQVDMEAQILVAGVGNAFLSDDAFGGHVAKALEERELPDGVTVMDFGTGGLDLAYEVMRGYHALVLVDISKQGGEPGTLYIIEPDPDEIEAGIEDGEVLNPHGMDPQTVLRFVKTVHGWPGKVVIVACEPAAEDEIGMGLSDKVKGAVEKAVDVVLEQIEKIRTQAAKGEIES
ncbi:MAG: hydrogenase maturation protease [Actinomycetota bacterium]|nr:hydrogenase maturation protease [Actinomycetota bacterium]